MLSIEIVGNEIIKFWKETFPQTVVVIFQQKYSFEDEYEIITTIAEPDNDGNIVLFNDDFCEGETDVIDIHIFTLEDVANIISG